MSKQVIITVLNDGETFTDADGVFTCAVDDDSSENIELQIEEDREELLFYTYVADGKVHIKVIDSDRVEIHEEV